MAYSSTPFQHFSSCYNSPMPRLKMHSSPEAERKIAARFIELRQLRDMSQSQFAKAIGLTRAQLSNIERAKSPLRYVNAIPALRANGESDSNSPIPYPFNPLWLFGSVDWPILLDWPMLLPHPESIGLSLPLRFSQFVAEQLPLLQIFASETPEHARLPESWLTPYASHHHAWHRRRDRALTADSLLIDIIAPSAYNIAHASPVARRVLQGIKQCTLGMAIIDHLTGKRIDHDELPPARLTKQERTEIEEVCNPNHPGVPEMYRLQERLQRATAPKGVKQQLAIYLTATPATIDDWLSGRGPDGETTLRLLRWLEHQEAEQERALSNTMLTHTAILGTLAPVKSQLDNLLDSFDDLIKRPGSKTDLANFLAVPLASVSRWLSGKREPGRTVTLKMLRWVEKQQRQQKQSAGSVEAPPAPKTQS